jgi:hypothetical protein
MALTPPSRARRSGRGAAVESSINSGGSFPQPHELRAVAPGETVFTHNVVDFQDERPAWRLYMLSEVIMSMCEVDEKNHLHLSNLYETGFRESAWLCASKPCSDSGTRSNTGDISTRHSIRSCPWKSS